MSNTKIHYRRVRRADFDGVRTVLERNGQSAPTTERAHLRRFRRIVGDLGSDVYVAVVTEQVVGFVHVTYTRGFVVAHRATVEALFVAPDWQRKGIGTSLIALARRRARRHDCMDILCFGAHNAATRRFLSGQGWLPAGECFRVDLTEGGQ